MIRRRPLISSGTPVVADCAGRPQAHPATIMLACDDGNAYLSGLHWTTWQSTAAAAGLWRINDCVPDCAAGTFHTFPATVKLWQPELLPGHAGLRFYSKITISLPHGHCYGTGGRHDCYPVTYTGVLHR
jgi:hypothetical protein